MRVTFIKDGKRYSFPDQTSDFKEKSGKITEALFAATIKTLRTIVEKGEEPSIIVDFNKSGIDMVTIDDVSSKTKSEFLSVYKDKMLGR